MRIFRTKRSHDIFPFNYFYAQSITNGTERKKRPSKKSRCVSMTCDIQV